MKFKCFMCTNTFESSNGFFVHLKNHVVPKNFIYECTYDKCYQKFSIKNAFKKHIEMHFKNNVDEPVVQLENFEENVSTPLSDIENENFVGINNSEYESDLKNIYNSAIKFTIKLHSFDNISRSDVNSIRCLVETLILDPIFQFIERAQNPSNVCNKSISKVLGDAKVLFENINSEAKLNKVLKEKDLIGNVQTFRINENNLKSNGIVMPLDFQFRKIFEHDDYLDKVLNHMEIVEKEQRYVNFIQGPLWKHKKSLYPQKIVIPFYLYADDFAINNALGSKSNKNSMCNFYYSFVCVPQKSSKLDDVYLASTVNSSDIKAYGNDCFRPIVNSLLKLEEEGILIETQSGIKRVHFVMALFLGDNLGLNCILGFSKSFSANYYCRFCLIKKSEAQKESYERPTILRNKINYSESIEQNLMSEAGINTPCIFNDLPSFHCTENFSVDVMHDVFEGVCHYVICEALLYFIKKMKYFTLNDLNERIKNFKYYPSDRGNEKLSISLHELENHKLKMSAIQMMCFYQYFTIIFGEFVMNQDPVWVFLLDFFEMIDDILSYEASDTFIDRLRSKIKNFNNNYQLIFKKHLTPKFHFLLHYATIIQQCGPLRQFWSFKYEGKHKNFKIYAHIITSRKNVSKTFSYKQQLIFANELFNSKTETDISLQVPFRDKVVKSMVSKKINIPIEDFSMYSHAVIWGYKYSTKQIVAIFSNDYNFYEIYLIVNTKNNDLLFCCKQLFCEFNIHFSAFEYGTVSTEYSIVSQKDIIGPPIEKLKTTKGETFLRVKDFYKNVY